MGTRPISRSTVRYLVGLLSSAWMGGTLPGHRVVPWMGRTGPVSWLTRTGTESQHSFKVHSQDWGQHAWHWSQGILPPVPLASLTANLLRLGGTEAQYHVLSGSLEMQIWPSLSEPHACQECSWIGAERGWSSGIGSFQDLPLDWVWWA